ncbi:Mediator of RNA polymerase II transcription subunit 14 [Exophiala dermatitidis]
MNGERPTANGEHFSNGIQQDTLKAEQSGGEIKKEHYSSGFSAPGGEQTPQSHAANGDTHANDPSKDDSKTGVDEAPTDILNLIPKDHYLPIAALIGRAAQSCWNGLTELVEELASIQVPEQPAEQTKVLPNNLPNNQTRENLDNKERLLRFANDQKADFIKLLVLLQWSKNVEDVSKTISINFWLMKRRQAYWDVIASLAALKQESAGFQIPNPDLKGAAEVLSTGRMRNFPTLGYIPQKDLSDKQILRILRTLDRSLSVRLTLSDDLPPQLRRYRVHDGRVTFTVANEFEVDLSVLDDKPDAPFRMVDFRFGFSPSPHIPDHLRAEIELYANTNIDRDGLRGCYLFLHELTLSYKLAEFHKQAVELARGQWTGNLRVEMIRRNLVIQYWPERPIGKSWIEIGIASGRTKKSGQTQDAIPFLEIKSIRQGKRAEALHLHLDDSVVSFEDVLRQIIAQHSVQILNSIYDKLVPTPLFANAELLLEQTSSEKDPEECQLTMQVSQSSRVQIKVEPVTGVLLISPVSERSERLQYELNRIQGVPEEIVSKLLNFRCSVREASVLAGITATSWEALKAFKFNQAELKALFGSPVVRINMFRQLPWGLDYTLAVTHGQAGDHWWLLQQLSSSGVNLQPRFRVIRSQRIEIAEELSAEHFEQLAEYATGLICLQRNVDYLKQKGEKVELPPLPTFGRTYTLPEISYDLDLSRPAFAGKDTSAPKAAHPEASEPAMAANSSRSMKLRFGGLDRAMSKVTMIGQFQTHASSAVLKHIDSSILDPDVTLNYEDRAVSIRIDTAVAEPGVPEIVAKAVDVEKTVSTVEQIHRLPGLQLKNLSKSAFTITYHADPPKEYGLTMTFTRGSDVPRLEFLPPEDNPHTLLNEFYSKHFAAGRSSFSSQVRDFFTSLTVTLPLLTFLCRLQDRHGLDSKDTQVPSTADGQKSALRVHVLPRTTTAFALQYFTAAGQAPSDVAGPGSNPHMLARLEILPHLNVPEKPMWLVRAALEDFQSYSRPSYSSPALRNKLRQEIFSRTDNGGKWLALDTAAVCKADAPETLLQAIHDLFCTWVKERMAGEGEVDNISNKQQQQQQQTGRPNNMAPNNLNLNAATTGGTMPNLSLPAKFSQSVKAPLSAANEMQQAQQQQKQQQQPHFGMNMNMNGPPPNGAIKATPHQWPPPSANLMNMGRNTSGSNNAAAKGNSSSGGGNNPQGNKDVITID